MSNTQNTTIAENLFERLESLRDYLNDHEYQGTLKDVVGLLADGEFDTAHEIVLMMEKRHAFDRSFETESDYEDIY